MKLTDKQLLITGADGFIGSHLTETLLDMGCRVRALSLYNSLRSLFCGVSRLKPVAKVLVLDDSFSMGTSYDLGGTFSDQEEIDEHTVYLQGQVSISGDRGYSNQAFYIWVTDENDNVVIDLSDQSISGNLEAGFYYICASISDPFSGRYYIYDPDFSGYIISVMDTGLDTSVESIANELGIDLTESDENERFTVLTDSSPNCVVYSGNDITIYGTSGTNQITIEKGAAANLMNFPGSNQIIIQGESGQFDITRSGATVWFQDTNNSTYLKIPATLTSQEIQFNDDTKILRIENSQITLDGIVVE